MDAEPLRYEFVCARPTNISDRGLLRPILRIQTTTKHMRTDGCKIWNHAHGSDWLDADVIGCTMNAIATM
jgi:hypothetical protein